METNFVKSCALKINSCLSKQTVESCVLQVNIIYLSAVWSQTFKSVKKVKTFTSVSYEDNEDSGLVCACLGLEIVRLLRTD